MVEAMMDSWGWLLALILLVAIGVIGYRIRRRNVAKRAGGVGGGVRLDGSAKRSDVVRPGGRRDRQE